MEIKLINKTFVKNNRFEVYELTNKNCMKVHISNYGARITRIIYHDIFMKDKDMVAGYNDDSEFVTNDNPYFNATIGRVANRIKGSTFLLNGKNYNLDANDGKNSLHGGNTGFDKKFWNAEYSGGKLKMSYLSPDGECGYPGNLNVSVTFDLNDNDELEIVYNYTSDKDTFVNLTNHAYFNLSGFESDIENHFLKINADKYTQTDKQLIPVSEKDAIDTPFDFKNLKMIGKDINCDNEDLKNGNGYDHNFILNNHNYEDCVAQAFSPLTQICLKVYTDMPCIQLYTGNGLDTKGREYYTKRMAFCLETQFAPDYINGVNAGMYVVHAGTEYTHRTKYAFSIFNDKDFEDDAKILVEELIAYAKKNMGMQKLDEVYNRNILLSQFKLNCPLEDVNTDKAQNEVVPDRLIRTIMGISARMGKVDSYTNAERFANYIMGIMTPLPSVINNNFYNIKAYNSIEKAEEYFYNLCIKNNYIQKTAIEKNIKWDFTDNDKKIEVTINLSKPEKNNKDIAKLVREKQAVTYPLCPLCIQNEGYFGSQKIQPRTNIRTITMHFGKEEWFMQYSPYAYYDEHCICINKNHTNMDITPKTINKLFCFIDVFPNYFIGSNASLPYIGGSILNHEHFQGGGHKMPMFSAKIKEHIEQNNYPDTKVGIVDWYNSVIMLSGKNRNELITLGGKIIEKWKNYENKKLMIINKSDGILHNSLSPVLRLNEDGEYNLYFILRNNIQTEEYPEGYFHAHPEYHNIKKEGIGLIEAMGLFILPGRLSRELAQIAGILCKDIPYNTEFIENNLSVHKNMIDDLINNYEPENYKQAINIVTRRVNIVCQKILGNTNVFGEDYNAFKEFVLNVVNKK